MYLYKKAVISIGIIFSLMVASTAHAAVPSRELIQSALMPLVPAYCVWSGYKLTAPKENKEEWFAKSAGLISGFFFYEAVGDNLKRNDSGGLVGAIMISLAKVALYNLYVRYAYDTDAERSEVLQKMLSDDFCMSLAAIGIVGGKDFASALVQA